MRFRAEQRLRRQLDIRTARERGRRIDCGGFTLWCHRRPGIPERAAAPSGIVDSSVATPVVARVCVVASTAAVGCAVLRNRAKRRMREVFRKNQTLVPPDCDLLMVARNSLNRLEYSEIERRFVDACQRLFAPKP
ncbi:ribonuclease P protein component [Opitutaceae bacterium EW11]|nr:ribonuclease P protein component [Opitutaceae bacterium EW11]